MNSRSVSLIMIPVLNVMSLIAVRAFPISCANQIDETAGASSGTDLSKINQQVTTEFLKAWNSSHNGVDKVEAVVLIYCRADGSYFAAALGQTNEANKLRFKWDPAAIAVTHTHPTTLDPKPSSEDKRVADKLRVPVFTMSRWGMYMYDPETKQIRKVQNNLDWLDSSKWVPNSNAWQHQ